MVGVRYFEWIVGQRHEFKKIKGAGKSSPPNNLFDTLQKPQHFLYCSFSETFHPPLKFITKFSNRSCPKTPLHTLTHSVSSQICGKRTPIHLLRMARRKVTTTFSRHQHAYLYRFFLYKQSRLTVRTISNLTMSSTRNSRHYSKMFAWLTGKNRNKTQQVTRLALDQLHRTNIKMGRAAGLSLSAQSRFGLDLA